MWRCLRGWIVFAGLLLGSTPAWAQYAGREQVLGFFFGPSLYDVGGTFDDYNRAHNINFDRPPEATFGMTFEYTITKWIGLEFLGSVSFGDIDTPVIIGYDFDHWNFTGNVVVHLTPDHRVVPFVTFGAGAAILVPGTGRSVTTSVFNAGAGVETFLGAPNWLFRAEVRAFNFRFDVSKFAGVTQQDLGLGTTFSERQTNVLVSLGVRYKFGGS
jgi:hypothetical protein